MLVFMSNLLCAKVTASQSRWLQNSQKKQLFPKIPLSALPQFNTALVYGLHHMCVSIVSGCAFSVGCGLTWYAPLAFLVFFFIYNFVTWARTILHLQCWMNVPLASHTVYLTMLCLFLECLLFSIHELLTSACDALFFACSAMVALTPSFLFAKQTGNTKHITVWVSEKSPRLHSQCKSFHILMNVSPILTFLSALFWPSSSSLHIVIWPIVCIKLLISAALDICLCVYPETRDQYS